VWSASLDKACTIMPVQLRQRLTCHYCGKRSRLSKKEGRKFRCEQCLAVNFFDEVRTLRLLLTALLTCIQNGDIADVPPEEAVPSHHFARAVDLPGNPTETSFQSSIFCSTCIKNQQLYTSALSEFLPDSDDPNYDQCEAALPEFKKRLEERYPQCCARCEPLVTAQLQQAAYNARSDHLRRVLEKSRARKIGSRWGWRSLVVNTAAAGYFSSLAVQLLWHAYGSQADAARSAGTIRPSTCLRRPPLPPECVASLEHWMPLSLGLGLLCVWWNPKWQHKLRNNEGRLVGLRKFYVVQLCLLTLRFLAWVIMQDMALPLRVQSILHSVFLVMITMVAGWSLLGIVKVDTTPLVNWYQETAPLLSPNQFVPPPAPLRSLQSPYQPSDGLSHELTVQDLAGPTTPELRSWRPPTPPADDSDAMDWTPSQPSFQPQLKEIRHKSSAPTPFYGTLPAMPGKWTRVNNTKPQSTAKKAIGLPPGFFDRPREEMNFQARQLVTEQVPLAQPKFFPHGNADTGLENIFASVFSLQDQSVEVQAPPPPSNGGAPASMTRLQEQNTGTESLIQNLRRRAIESVKQLRS